jgi:hypothetical protein
MFESCEIVPLFMYLRDEAIGCAILSMNGGFCFREDEWAVVSDKL